MNGTEDYGSHQQKQTIADSGLRAALRNIRLFFRDWRFVAGLIFLFSLSVAGMLWHTAALQNRLVRSTALNNAELYSQAIREFRSIYTQEVVSKAIKSGMVVSHDYVDQENTIPLPASMSILLGQKIGEQGSGAHARLYSNYPFPWRQHELAQRDEFGSDALAYLTLNPQKSYYRFESMGDHEVLRYATADLMRSSCIDCHNSHAQSPKRDWKIGDVRGAVEIVLPIGVALAQTRENLTGTFSILVVMSAIGVLGIALVVGKLRHDRETLQERVIERTAELQTELTERKQAELAVKQSEARIRKIIDTALDAVIVIDPQSQIIDWNQQAEQTFGYTKAEAMGQRLDTMLIPQQYRSRHLEGVTRYLNTGVGPVLNRRIEITALHKDGRVLPIELAITSLTIGNAVVFGAFLRDITLRKDAETALRCEKEAAEAAVTTLRQLGEVGREITANLDTAAVCEALHRHVGTLLDAPFFTLFRMDATGTLLERAFGREDGQPLPKAAIALDSATSNAARAARERQEVLVELVPDAIDPSHIPGTRKMLTVLFAPLIVDTRLLAVMSIQSDREHAYGERERLIFRTLCAYGAIALANAEAQVQVVQAEKMASLGQLVANVAHEINTPIGAVKSSGTSIADRLKDVLAELPKLGQLLNSEDAQRFVALVSQAYAPGESLSTREERTLRRELVLQLESVGFDRAAMDGATKKGAASEAAAIAGAPLTECDRKARLLLMLHAHANWQDYLPLLRHPEYALIHRAGESLAAIINGAANIATAVDRVSKIVLALKSFASADSSGESLDVDVGQALNAVLAVYHNQIKQGVELVLDCEPTPPLHFQPDDLNQLWTHLIHNALQAMQYQGKLSIGIHLRNRDDRDEVVLSVSDTGHGIPDDIRPKIFDAFFTTRRTGEGSGLGLYLIQKIVDKHQGRVEVHSEVGMGTVFTVCLPIPVPASVT